MSEILTGSPAGTIYGTYLLAVAYIDGQFGPAYRAWEALAVADRKRALLAATRYLDRQSWIDTADTFAERDAIAEFPLASYELAALAAEDASVLSAADQGSNIESVNAGGAGVSFFKPTTAVDGSASKLPTVVDQLVGEYLAVDEVLVTVIGGSGVCGDEHDPFAAHHGYGRTEPW